MRLVLASRNLHKLRELRQLMCPYELDPLPDDVRLPPETGTTFSDNALIKARAAAAATGRPALADDSGIEAAALHGAPGVWSARYAGPDASDEENLTKLLEDVPDDGDRRVAYVCMIAYVEPGGREELAHGRCEGRLAYTPQGSGGFGYDPAFIPDDYPDDRTMAELTPEEKDAISHRGRAARALVRKLLEAQEEGRPRLFEGLGRGGRGRGLGGGGGRGPGGSTGRGLGGPGRGAGGRRDRGLGRGAR